MLGLDLLSCQKLFPTTRFYLCPDSTDTKGQKALQDAFLNGTTVKVKMYVDATNYYQGDAYISSLSIEDPVDDVVSISIEFTGTGALSFEAGAGGSN